VRRHVHLRQLTIDVGDDRRNDLLARLGRSRFTSPNGRTPWAAGADPTYLAKFTRYWRHEFDWRVVESDLNRLDHRVAEVSGTDVHFVRFEPPAGAARDPRPVMLSHGWPSSFLEMIPLAQRLSDPAAFGQQRPAREVIVPSLPGFAFSQLPDAPLTRPLMAQLLHTLMTERLGHQRYFVFGGDIGGAVGGWMASLYPQHVAGVHLIHPPMPASFEGSPLTPEEQAVLDYEDEFDEMDRGYSEIMGTRPDTIAAALVDSPVGLAAWIIDKLRAWSDCHGDVESRFSRHELATLVSLYWFTDSIGTSFRQYLDWAHNPPRGAITPPSAFTLSSEMTAARFPRSMAERACSSIRVWHEPNRGGHFLAFEEPDLMADELTDFFVGVD
jgi:pimeloyl-ACP methyl ester carboxylesterase